MRASQFRAAVAAVAGYEPTDDQVNRAVNLGIVTVEKRGGWFFFKEENVAQMHRYLKTRSRNYAFRGPFDPTDESNTVRTRG